MKIIDTIILVDAAEIPNTQPLSNLMEEISSNQLANVEPPITPGKFSQTETWKKLHEQITGAILKCEWPENTGTFTLYDEQEGNGVTPIKKPCMEYLKSQGWQLETPSRVATAIKPGKIDATIPVGDKLFCVEWETGNISSSHRALNKLAVGLIQGDFIGGVLIVPSRKMYYYLTSRVGNIRELKPYFPIYQAIRVLNGILAIIVIEHDMVSKEVPPIPKGKDGNSLGRRKLLEEGRYITGNRSRIRRPLKKASQLHEDTNQRSIWDENIS